MHRRTLGTDPAPPVSWPYDVYQAFNYADYDEYLYFDVPATSGLTVSFWARNENPDFCNQAWYYYLDGRAVLNESYVATSSIGSGWQVYADGVLQTATNLRNVVALNQWQRFDLVATAPNAAGRLFVNARYSEDEFTAKIKFADIRVYDRPLTSVEIATGAYQASGLTNRYTFLGVTAASVPDASGNHRPATLMGRPVPAVTGAPDGKLRITGLSPNGGDNSLFLDQVEILDDRGQVVVGAVRNAGFERPVQQSPGYAYYDGFLEDWFFRGTGIRGNGTAWGGPDAPEGRQCCFVQDKGPYLEQTLRLPPGTYAVRLLLCQRVYGGGPSPNTQRIQVSYDGRELAQFEPATTAFAPYVTPAFRVSSAPVAASAGDVAWTSALSRDLQSSYVTIPNLGPVAPAANSTIEMWCKLEDATPAPTIAYSMSGDDGTNRIMAHVYWSDGQIYFDNGSIHTQGRLSAYRPQSLADGAWTHLAFVVDATASKMLLYVNGHLFAQRVGFDLYPRRAADFQIGGAAGGRHRGRLGEFRIWSKARSQAEIQATMNLSLAGPKPSLLACWRLDDAGLTILDRSGHDYHGTAVDSAPAEAVAFLSATAITDGAQQAAVIKLVEDLQSAGLWGKMSAIYPMVGGTAFTHQFNLKDPRDADDAFRIHWVSPGSARHSARGAEGTGTGAGLTGLAPAAHLPQDSVHLAFYAGSQAGGPGQVHQVFMGAAEDDFSHGLYLFARQYDNLWSFRANSSREDNAVRLDRSEVGLNVVSRTAASVAKLFSRGDLITDYTGVNPTTARTSAPIALFGINHAAGLTNHSRHLCQFASIGRGLSDAEVGTLSTLVHDYQLALGRAAY